MGQGTLTIYGASAGSGKTYTLTEIFLKSLFMSRNNYRRILAVTFTHKATAEMKTRILDSLSGLAEGGESKYLDKLIKSTGKNEEWLRKEARAILGSILHDYSRFSVSTIDSFFQKILRAFTREAGLNSGFSIELDNELILSQAIDEMIGKSHKDPLLREWLRSYVLSNISADKTWNLKNEISSLSRELFRENFRILSADQQDLLSDKQFLAAYIAKLRNLASGFESELRKLALKASDLISGYGLSDEMFYQKGRGVGAFVRSIASGIVKEPNQYVRAALGSDPRWFSAKSDPRLEQALSAGFGTAVSDLVEFYDRGIIHYN
ncbi:MAG: UvrD-helicase domain-containing protein, partial [Bacteroidales bacterium]|nr:UvrD-helicase domain-containing protein [Bacteroidales bacterium]